MLYNIENQEHDKLKDLYPSNNGKGTLISLVLEASNETEESALGLKHEDCGSLGLLTQKHQN